MAGVLSQATGVENRYAEVPEAPGVSCFRAAQSPTPPEMLSHGAVHFSTSLSVPSSMGLPKCQAVILVQRQEDEAALNPRMLPASHSVRSVVVALNLSLFAAAAKSLQS